MHLRILPDHQHQVLKKDIFLRLEWLKTCFNAFPGRQNQVLKKDIFQRLEVHFLTTRINFFKKMSGVVKNGF